MPGAEPPVSYAWWVLALGLLLLVLAAVWLWWVLRRPRTPSDRDAAAAEVRRTYAVRVQELYDGFTRGETDLRGFHLALAGLLREFGSERTGRDLSAMTRGEVSAAFPRTGLGRLLARYEQPSFSRDSRVEAETTLRQTLEVIAGW